MPINLLNPDQISLHTQKVLPVAKMMVESMLVKFKIEIYLVLRYGQYWFESCKKVL